MRNKIGKVCILLGVILILGACGLLYRNQTEAREAQRAADEALSEMLTYFTAPTQPEHTEETEPLENPEISTVYPDPYDPEMTVVDIEGYGYIGYLSIPDLGKVLPVMSQWDYDRLKIAPCRYNGSTKTGDLILCAHNYDSHFGDIASMSIGAEITFTDMDGIVTVYEVAEITVLQPTAIEEMESGEYPLTLFTCTYGGQSRVTVRCAEKTE